MLLPDSLYSRVVAWLKILLPLAALALLSTLFLLARSTEPVMNVPFADALTDGEAAREQVGKPFFSGITPRGDTLMMTADYARPEDGGIIRAEALEARIRTVDGSELLLDAPGATLREGSEEIRLDGGVRIESSTGYVVTTDTLTSSIERISAHSDGPVSAVGPAGLLEAGKLEIEAQGENDAVHLLFSGGVKLVYDPQSK